MSKELWLEFGVIDEDQNNWHETYWYNEGRPEEIPYFMAELEKRINEPNKSGKMYFIARYGKENSKEIVL